MKITTPSSDRKQGFTLIELLVVIAIIAVLAALGFGAGGVAMKKAKNTACTQDCTNLVQAVEAFYDDNNYLPVVAEADTSPGAKTTKELMDQLIGVDKENNPKETRYYQGKQAKGKNANTAYGGLFYTGRSAELFDSWRKKGNAAANRHFFVLMDTKFIGEIVDPFDNTTPLYGRKAIAWSTGQDGEFTSGQANATKNRDNVYSWKQ